MNIYHMVEMVRSLTGQQAPTGSIPSRTGGYLDDQEIVRFINLQQDKLMNRIQAYKRGHLVKSSTFGFTSGEYELPVYVKGRPVHIRREDQGSGKIRNPQEDLGTSWFYESDLHLPGKEHIEYYDNTLRAVPSPGTTGASAFRMWYNWRLPWLHWGTATAGGATTITLESNLWVDRRNDYYNGVYLEIVSGTGANEGRAEITDYTGLTRVATWTTPSTTPDATSIYAMISPIPEQFHMILIYEAAKLARIKNEKETTDLDEALSELREMMMVELGMHPDMRPQHTEQEYDDLMEA